MELGAVMRSTFAARAFTDEPVSDAVVHGILEDARFAPSGGNRQGWKVVVVRKEATRNALTPLLRPTVQRYFAQVRAGEAPFNPVHPTALSTEEIAAVEISDDALRWLTHAPVLLFVFVDLSVVAAFDAEADHVGVIAGCSIYPFVHNILLAARDAGYGGTPTTFIGAAEPELKTLLGVPEPWAFASMIPLGRPVKQLTRLKRRPVESFAVLEHFDGPSLRP